MLRFIREGRSVQSALTIKVSKRFINNRQLNGNMISNHTVGESGMPLNRYARIGLYATATFLLVLALVTLCTVIEQRRTQSEMSSVLSALLSEEVLQDVQQSGYRGPVQIVIQQTPDCQMCPQGSDVIARNSWFEQSLRGRGRIAFSRQFWFPQASGTTRISFFLNSIFRRQIKTELHLPGGAQAFFVNLSDLGTHPNDFEARFPSNLGYFVVSHVGMNLRKTEAVLYVDHFCRGLCGGGSYVLLQKTSGVWHVVDQHGTWVS